MLAGLPLWLIALAVGVAGGAVAALLIPPISKRRGLEAAHRAGAVWAGLAHFNASESGQAPVVQRALSGVGPMYGAFFAQDWNRPLGGRLLVFADHITWEPGLWLGRGRPKPWTLQRADITSVETDKLPPPAVRSFEATLHTSGGPIHFLVADPDGLRQALSD